jgi:ABC-type uncharacterized transport system substrate-binding protein
MHLFPLTTDCFSIMEGRAAVQHGESDPGWLWRSSEERLMALSSTRRRFADLVRGHVAVIATPASNAARACGQSRNLDLPIVFGASDDPVSLGLVASLARPASSQPSNPVPVRRPVSGVDLNEPSPHHGIQ